MSAPPPSAILDTPLRSRVVPLYPDFERKPVDWFKDRGPATDGILDAWASQFPEIYGQKFAVRMGRGPSRKEFYDGLSLIALDVDVRDALPDLRLPETLWTTKTSRGIHCVYQHEPLPKQQGDIYLDGEHVGEFKAGHNVYIVAPWSPHHKDDSVYTPSPGWGWGKPPVLSDTDLERLIDGPVAAPVVEGWADTPHEPFADEGKDGFFRSWGIYWRVPAATEGERNSTLFMELCRALGQQGNLRRSAGSVLTLASVINELFVPPLLRSEVETVVEKVLSYRRQWVTNPRSQASAAFRARQSAKAKRPRRRNIDHYEELAWLVSMGFSTREVAGMHGVSHMTVSRAVRRAK